MTRSNVSFRIEESDGPGELVPDHMLPVQFADLVQRPSDRSPELRLMAAVLEDAVRTFCRCAGVRGVRNGRLFRETAEWFESSDLSWPYAFENVCDALGIEAAWLRRLLDDWYRIRTASGQRPARIPCIRRIAGSRHAVSGRAPTGRHVTRLAG